ncbi:MAG: class I SAM-dependent methyltransferase [Clostridiaceae bacterium]|nr:class I SAM-dependent methyltransferase [Clostridiaceae bacterium]
MIKLTPRLALCAEMCPWAGRAIDVGCDHGYLIIKLILDEKAQRGMACDLRAGPLRHAKSNIRFYGLENIIETLQTDGLDGIPPSGDDLITICGIGGDNIADILKRAPWTKDAAIVAQPMTKQHRLRRFLSENGYNIFEERLIYEDRRLYTLMRIGRGEYRGESHMLYSEAMESDRLFPDYIKMMHSKYQKRYSGNGEAHDREIASLLEEKMRWL